MVAAHDRGIGLVREVDIIGELALAGHQHRVFAAWHRLVVCQVGGGDERVHDLTVTYVRIAALGIPFMLVALAGEGYLRGVADLRTPLVVLVACNALNVVLVHVDEKSISALKGQYGRVFSWPRSLHAQVVDATRAVLVIHQNHDYSHTTYGPSKEEMMASEECILNARLTCEENPGDYEQGFFWRYAYTIDDATHRLTRAGIQKNPRRLWKQFKRYSSRPLGMAKLIRRRFVHPQHKAEKIVAESRR